MTYTVTIQNEVQVCPGLHTVAAPGTSLAYSVSSVYGPDHHADRLHRVEASAIVGPEDPILEFAAVDASGVPDTIKIGLAASVVPPASFMEMGTVTCCGETGRAMISSIRKFVFHRENDSKEHSFKKINFLFLLKIDPLEANKLRVIACSYERACQHTTLSSNF